MNVAARRRPTRRRSTGRLLAALAVAAAALPVVPSSPGRAAADGPVIDAPQFREVGRVPVPTTAEGAASTFADSSGWLVLDPASRRGYTLTWLGFAATLIQSFDLDTLRPRQQAVVSGYTITGGFGVGTPAATATVGELVHAVDPVAKRIYLPMSGTLGGPFDTTPGPEVKRRVLHFLVLDEEAFDRDPATAFGAFTFAPLERHLAEYSLLGLAVNRRGVAPGRPGRLVGLLASPVGGGLFPNPHDHRLAQWDAGGVAATGPAPSADAVAVTLAAQPVSTEWNVHLEPCRTAPIESTGSAQSNFNYQWGILPAADAVYTVCQSAQGSGAVLRVGYDDSLLGGGDASATDQQVVPLGKPVTDVVTDPEGGRLILESSGNGTTWWAFDTAEMRFTGSMAGSPADSDRLTAGIDPATGRFYTLAEDTCVTRAGGSAINGLALLPVRGGLGVAEPRLDPVPAARNVVPELAYPSWWRIGVDPVAGRVFLRRGVFGGGNQRAMYPSCERPGGTAPVENFWRVYEDRIPLPEPTVGFDDTLLTTNVAEAAGRTEASYLGSGSGYGSRALLVGGLDKLASGALTIAKSLCGSADRELLAGSVGKVEVSEQTIAAEAAALDADAGTQAVLGDPLSRCRPQAPSQPLPQASPQQPGPRNLDELNRCSADVRELSLDQAQQGVDDNKDGCFDRDGENRYAAACLGTRNAANPGFDDDEHNVPRDGFEARASCEERDEKASGSATGSMSSSDQSVTVAESTSTVTVDRTLGKGVTVKVDSVARGVEIEGRGTIGVVRGEAVSTATGRDGRASGSFTRTVCDIDVAGVRFPGCLSEGTLRGAIEQINRRLSGRVELRLRSPDPVLAAGSPHGYLAAVQRDRKERFGDQEITRDRSLAVPALEIITYQGEGSGAGGGAGRQVYQLAGAQASTSYGIVCSFGRKADGQCAAVDEEAVAPDFFGDLPPEPGEPSVTTITETLPGETALPAGFGGTGLGREGTVTRLLRAIPRAVAEALRLLFNNPRELGLLAALWALLYAPCYLGDRRRAVRAVAARRL